jgi:dTDP-4-amino-4,6-dideoxygalactose transaminase
MINVTKSFLPPYAEYEQYLKQIWHTGWLTNHGPLVLELEKQLKEYLDIEHLFYLNNGTVALQIAIKAMHLKGEIITTPFSYVATTSSIVWEGCTPVFADISEKTLNICSEKVEQKITEQTSAILVTHVFGNACEIDKIKEIAQKYNLKVIYDAAHCFGTTYKGKSIFSYGDISATSFHATKLFHTIEGGALITNNDELAHKISYMRNFGHNGYEAFYGIGINGKNSEFHAAMGLCNLKYINTVLEKRKMASLLYDDYIKESNLIRPEINPDCKYNYAYYPVIFDSEATLKKIQIILNKHQIFPRRYFYPSLCNLPYVKENEIYISKSVSNRILCLPLFYEITEAEIKLISKLILDNL